MPIPVFDPQPSTHETRQFARETKFVTTLAMRPAILAWARTRLAADGHGTGANGDEYHTATLYFETGAFDVYNRRGSYGRSKYRVRRYNSSDMVFLERKFRTRRLLAKRRSLVPLADLEHLRASEPDRKWAGYWFGRRITLRQLRPLLQLSYDRVARIGESAMGPIRMTIDANLHALPMHDLAFLPGCGLPFVEDACIVEVKYRVAMPAIFKELAETFGLEVATMSKFRSALRALDYPLAPEPHEEETHPLSSTEADAAGRFFD